MYAKEQYLKEKFFNELKKCFPRKVANKFDCDVAENDSIINLTITLGENTQAVFVTYAKKGDSMLASYIRPSAIAKDPRTSGYPEIVMNKLKSTLEPIFGKPVVSYDSTCDELGIIMSSTFEWVEKTKAADTIKQIRQGKGVDPFYSVFNIKDLREDESFDEGCR